jgi:NADH-quinone oxidoreductase subunit E
MVNWEFMDNQTPESATQLVDDLREGKEVRSTRGPRICTWREAERVLAGFPDDRADEGPAAGPASLLGLQIARENGWTAPEGDRERVSTGSTGRDGSTGGTARTESGAAAQADTGRAESETTVKQSGAETVGEDAGGEQNSKGGS